MVSKDDVPKDGKKLKMSISKQRAVPPWWKPISPAKS
jgi:hypothetical protein